MFMQAAATFVATDAIRPAGHKAAALLSGIVAGTLVDTATGWRAVETLRRGDAVHTVDGGLREVALVDRQWLLPADNAELVMLPGGLLGAAADMLLPADQHLLIDTWDCDGLTDAVAALVPASRVERAFALPRRRVARPVELVTPLFQNEEVIWANSGLQLHCPGIRQGAQSGPADSFYPLLDDAVATAILTRQASLRAA